MHVDDIIILGTRQSLSWFKAKLGGRFEVKSKVIGSADEETECRLLRSVIVGIMMATSATLVSS